MKAAILAALIATTLAASAIAQAPDVPVDLELVLATDVSASIDPEEAAFQRAGYLAALTNPEVVDAIRRGVLGRIAVIYVEWAGVQRTVVGWTVIADEASALAFTLAVRSQPLSSGAGTSISGVLDYAAGLFDNNGFEGTRRVIDISGDGRNFSGRPLGPARADVLAKGITINALPMLYRDAQGQVVDPGLDTYYSQRVIGGPGAFMVPAFGANAFPEAILKKLIIEIAGLEDPADYPAIADISHP